ncbi:hypothetical protein [Pontibacter sp. G13]|uniref:hypothetical protein n=1 Tax=Pontibacter sp. G13 TaxID=3074898 RepID=UPI002889D156|nr:hypothetical protein [Pontibacter sp. G13]WNJ19024.1 hypothetical protein RJD25_00915 [Pontibacter sp. G13]
MWLKSTTIDPANPSEGRVFNREYALPDHVQKHYQTLEGEAIKGEWKVYSPNQSASVFWQYGSYRLSLEVGDGKERITLNGDSVSLNFGYSNFTSADTERAHFMERFADTSFCIIFVRGFSQDTDSFLVIRQNLGRASGPLTFQVMLHLNSGMAWAVDNEIYESQFDRIPWALRDLKTGKLVFPILDVQDQEQEYNIWETRTVWFCGLPLEEG